MLKFQEVKEKKSSTKPLVIEPNTSFMSMLSTKSRYSYFSGYASEIATVLYLRELAKAFEMQGEEKIDITPRLIVLKEYSEKFKDMHDRLRQEPIMKEIIHSFVTAPQQSMTRMGAHRQSMDFIINGIGSCPLLFDRPVVKPQSKLAEIVKEVVPVVVEPVKPPPPFTKVRLSLSSFILLYDQWSTTALKDGNESVRVLMDNKYYEYLTVGKGKIRRRSDAEAQTDMVLWKSRDVNTTRVKTEMRGTFVSNYEMYDTYKKLEESRMTMMLPEEEPIYDTMNDQWAYIKELPEFKLAKMITKRLLSSNVHEAAQRRYRNMDLPDPFAKHVSYRYAVNILFRFRQQSQSKERKSVTDISFCHKNGDILAVSYGIYSYTSMHVPKSGYVCVWSIKNPGDPERIYHYETPVASLEFSARSPTLLAIGLFDGTVEVRDITQPDDDPVAVSQRLSSPSWEPAVAIKWIAQGKDEESGEPDSFLALSQDGFITKFTIISSPYLLAFKQMELERVEGSPEGLKIKPTEEMAQLANTHPQGMGLTMHPVLKDIYYVLTDEGCIHKCSTNYQHQHLDVLRAHEAAVNYMDFSPWSPKMFLTCGSDWCTRIWVDGIFKPILTLQNNYVPVHCAFWSRTHSTVILCLSRKALEVWDLRRNTLQPVSTTAIDTSFYTMAKFARCGRTIAIGNERGNVLMASIDEMPFQPRFQYDELEKAIFNAISTFPELINELKSVGYFGYPNKDAVVTY